MLISLHIRNFALIDDLKIEFTAGLNIFTGETGAGKSILIDALDIVLGGRASAGFIREGTDACTLQAVFAITSTAVSEILAEADIPVDEELLFIRRKLLSNGKSSAYLNDVQVPTSTVQRVAVQLIAIHGQHENQELLRAETPLDLLTLYRPQKIGAVLAHYQELYKEYLLLSQRLTALNGRSEQREATVERLQWEIDEITAAAFAEDDEETLHERERELGNGTKIIEAVTSAYRNLDGDENGSAGALALLAEAVRKLETAVSFTDKLTSAATELRTVLVSLEDVRRELAVYQQDADFDPSSMSKLQERLDLLYRLKSKYGTTIAEINRHAIKAETELQELATLGALIAATSKQRKQIEEQLLALAEEIAQARRDAAVSFAAAVVGHLGDLAMADSKMEIRLTPTEKLTPTGCDIAEIYFSANVGQSPRPLSKVVSGGELSRLALAVKTVLLGSANKPTMVFDEIDTGVGGLTAQKMGEKLTLISADTQVLCVTHLPQIAAFADHHLSIEKKVREGRTVTEVQSLEKEEIPAELMRMAGAEDRSAVSRSYAEELKIHADKAKNLLRAEQQASKQER